MLLKNIAPPRYSLAHHHGISSNNLNTIHVTHASTLTTLHTLAYHPHRLNWHATHATYTLARYPRKYTTHASKSPRLASHPRYPYASTLPTLVCHPRKHATHASTPLTQSRRHASSNSFPFLKLPKY